MAYGRRAPYDGPPTKEVALHVVIVGSGFTGTMIAVQLTRQARKPVRVTLIERAARFAAGVAYSTVHAGHLLNVPVGRMSAFPDDEDHFLRWTMRRNPSVRGGDFVGRAWYAAYLADVLDEAAQQVPRASMLERVFAEVVSVRHAELGRLEVSCADGKVMSADTVVLAIGNYPPANPPCETVAFYSSDLYRQDPWKPGAMDVDADSDVLLLGSGLTMVDVAVSLNDRGHRGRVHCVSRRGLVPQSHREATMNPPHREPPESWRTWPATAAGMCRELRLAIERAERDGLDWRDVVTSLRPITSSLWAGLPEQERRRFLTHLRPYFDTHRHRTAPAIGRTIQSMRESGRLNVKAGRVIRYDLAAGGVDVQVRDRGGESIRTIRVARVINCTGPDTDLLRVREPLVQDLREREMIRPDALGLGLDTDERGRVIDGRGVAQERLYLAGPLRRGRLWENIAVPELREEARRLAGVVLEP